MKFYKILVKGHPYPIVLGILKSFDAESAISRFRYMTGDMHTALVAVERH